MAEENTAASSTKSTMRKAHCSNCGGERNCEVRGQWKQQGDYEEFMWETSWYILECRGCEHVFVQTVNTNSEDYLQYYGSDGEENLEYTETISYWPALAKRDRPDWMTPTGIDVPGVGPLDGALLELYTALANDLSVLAGIGIRTCFDIASELLKVDPDWPFQRKLDALVGNGQIGAVDRRRLATLVDAGSASAHRGWKPSQKELSTMMDVLEHFIFETFVSPHRRKLLDADVEKLQVPQRAKRQSMKGAPLPAKET